MAKFKFQFTRAYTITEGFERIIEAPSLAEAQAAAGNLAREFDDDCPDDCAEFEGGAHDNSTGFDADCTSAEVPKASDPDYVVQADGQCLLWED